MVNLGHTLGLSLTPQEALEEVASIINPRYELRLGSENGIKARGYLFDECVLSYFRSPAMELFGRVNYLKYQLCFKALVKECRDEILSYVGLEETCARATNARAYDLLNQTWMD